jgi:glycosyltransferase involved in cell wall biosynthesis
MDQMNANTSPPATPDSIIAGINAGLGRQLRVLHIGNIANNAYNNARIQRQYGIDADVLCHDYYHVMATPEWEDGGLTTQLDPNLPNWWESNLKGYRRPDWYVQGPLTLCLDYLDALRRGQTARRFNTALNIESAYVELLRQHAVLHNRKWRDSRPFLQRNPAMVPLATALASHKSGLPYLREVAFGVKTTLARFILRAFFSLASDPRVLLRSIGNKIRRLVLWPLLAAACAEPPRIRGAKLVIGAYRLVRRYLGGEHRDDHELRRCAAALVPENATLTWIGSLGRLGSILFDAAKLAALLPFHILAKWASDRLWPAQKTASVEERRVIADDFISRLIKNARWDSLPPELREEFNKRIVHHALLFGPILEHYDIIQGYSIDGFIPLVNGRKAFASYEHGTLRELPFEASLTGLICNISYAHSPAVFVTNTDVLPSVERLGLDPDKVHNLPHAFDDRKLMDWRNANPELAPPSDEVVFFSPTRQHWRDENRSLTKGNDIMLRAAGALWAEGRRFRMVLVEWGQDIAATRQLVDGLGFGEAVRWVPPMGKQDLWRAYCTSHAVLDQFILPALGGVGFEALALGCRLISRTEQAVLSRFFGEAPPVLPAASVEEVAASMRMVLDDPEDSAGIGAAGRNWIDTWHSARRTVSIQAGVYRDLLAQDNGGPPNCWTHPSQLARTPLASI